MNRKVVLILVGGILIALVSFRLIFANKKSTSNNLQIKEGSAVTETPTAFIASGKNKSYNDPSGFKLSYPDNLTVENKNTPSSQAYSLLQLTTPKSDGKVMIEVVDTTAKSIDNWIQTNKPKSVSSVKKIKLADLEARQYQDQNQITTTALDGTVLFKIITNLTKDKDEWTKINDIIIKNFEFAPPPASTDNSSSSDSYSESSDVIDEGEEIIE